MPCARRPIRDLDDAARKALPSNDDPKREAEEVRLGQFDPGGDVPVVEEAGFACGLQSVMDATRLAHGAIIGRDQGQNLRRTAVLGFMQLGRDLLEAKAQLEHGQWIKLLDSLHFNRRIASRFIRIARWGQQMGLSESHLVRLLPPDYNSLDIIARLDQPTFERLVGDGTISPTLQRTDIARIQRGQRVYDDEQRVRHLVPIVGKFRELVIDPGWDHGWLSLAGRGLPPYAKQSLESLRELDVAAWADEKAGCHLYLCVIITWKAAALRAR
jgi:hypothetical protein